MDVFQVRKRRLDDLVKVEKALAALESACDGVPGSVWAEHSRLAVRRHQLALGVSMDLQEIEINQGKKEEPSA